MSILDQETNVEEGNGHGTTIAGLIGSQSQLTNLDGIAPNLELYSLKVLDNNGFGYYSDIIEGLEWAIENDINIVNMSFGGNKYSEILEILVNTANNQGLLLVASVGNNGETLSFVSLNPS